jgi:hypothetical protein
MRKGWLATTNWQGGRPLRMRGGSRSSLSKSGNLESWVRFISCRIIGIQLFESK